MNKEDIKRLRGKLGLTQEGFAQALGVKAITVNRWEQGISKPSKVTLKKLETFKRKAEGKKAGAAKTKKILVVDDEEEIRAVLLEILSFLGYEAEAAVSGEEALTVFDETEHALLIVDHYMPRMQGAELIRVLLRRCPSLPVIAMTGAGPETESVLLAAGAHQCLRKPINISRLQEAIEKVLEEKISNPGPPCKEVLCR